MRITWEIGNQITFFRDGEVWKSASKSLYINLLRGKTECSLEAFLALEKKCSASYAASLLAKRALTSGMLRSKLMEKGFEGASIDHALNMLESYGYLNDDKRVEAAVEKYARSGYGPAYITPKLQQSLKLSYAEAGSAMSKYWSDELLHLAFEVAKKKVRKKTYQAFYRRGFPCELISSVLSEDVW